jgi:hypothetical protein
MYEYFRNFIYDNPEFELGTGRSIFDHYIDTIPPIYEYGIQLTNALLLRIKDLAESHNSRFFVFMVKEPLQLFSTAITICYKDREYTLSFASYCNRLERAFDGTEYHFIDGLPADYQDKIDSHLSDKANRYVMRRVAELIAERLKETIPMESHMVEQATEAR